MKRLLPLVLALCLLLGSARADECFYQLVSFLSLEEVLGTDCTVADIPEENQQTEACMVFINLPQKRLMLAGNDQLSENVLVCWNEVDPELLSRLTVTLLGRYQTFADNLTEHQVLLFQIQTLEDMDPVYVADQATAEAVCKIFSGESSSEN